MVNAGSIWTNIGDTEAFLEEHSIEAAKPLGAPMPLKDYILPDNTKLNKPEHTLYRSCVGSLQYFVCGTQ